MLQTDTVSIQRLADGQYQLHWDTQHPETMVNIALLEEHSDSSNSEPLTATTDKQFSIDGLQVDRRHLFHLADDQGNETVISHRHIPMQGTPNFRDFGGYHTDDGRKVKWGYLFRSGQMARLRDPDLNLFADLQLDLVCDFRRASEQESEPSRMPEDTNTEVVGVSITPGSFGNSIEAVSSANDMFEFMVAINKGFALEQQAQYASMFNHMLSIGHGRTLVHCTAGKDRTGFAAAIILLALGVSKAQVMEDYLLTAKYFNLEKEVDRIAKKYDLGMNPSAVRPMLEVHPEYLQAALDAIDENYPSLEAYLEQHLGVDAQAREKLKAMYLI